MGLESHQTDGVAHASVRTEEDVLRLRAEELATEVVEEHVEEVTAFLAFRLGEEWYAVGVEHVREIYQEYEVTPIPCVPDFILGVVNIRGEILSVTDLARLMHAEGATSRSSQAPAVVLENAECATAVVVDEVGDIVEVPVDSLEPPVSVIDRYHAEFAAGSAALDGKLVGLLNVERILAPVGEAPRY